MASRVTTEEIAQTSLFKGFTLDQVKDLLSRTGVLVKHFHRNDYVYLAGDNIDNLCVVINGKVQIIKEDIAGEKSILGTLEPGDTFAENNFAARTHSVLSYSVVDDSDIFMLNFGRLTMKIIQNPELFSKFFHNLMEISGQNTAKLLAKVDILGKRSLRGKIMAYLEQEAQLHNSPTFELPFNRTDMANYLDADRSAMTRELCKMRDEGLIKFEKNVFMIKVGISNE